MDTSPATAKPEADRLDKVFVLVHGTWARKAEWIEPESDFAKKLTSKVPYSRTSAFRWSGRNSDRARRDAGKKLAEHTANLRRERPDAEIAVVGHSHGGNVALNAYRDPCGQQSIEKIVCLGTPFFSISSERAKASRQCDRDWAYRDTLSRVSAGSRFSTMDFDGIAICNNVAPSEPRPRRPY